MNRFRRTGLPLVHRKICEVKVFWLAVVLLYVYAFAIYNVVVQLENVYHCSCAEFEIPVKIAKIFHLKVLRNSGMLQYHQKVGKCLSCASRILGMPTKHLRTSCKDLLRVC